VLILATYPLIKRFFAVPQAYLGVAYSFGILMAYMQITDGLSFGCWLLFIANLFWVVGYDTIYALVDIDDDRKIGIYSSALTLGGKVVPFIFGCYITFTILMALVAVLSKLSWIFWIFWAIGLLLLIYQVIILTTSDRLKWFKMFLLNNRVGYIMLLAIIFGLWF
jgi:4-hydroxybenzoate polyprenyltransferase